MTMTMTSAAQCDVGMDSRLKNFVIYKCSSFAFGTHSYFSFHYHYIISFIQTLVFILKINNGAINFVLDLLFFLQMMTLDLFMSCHHQIFHDKNFLFLGKLIVFNIFHDGFSARPDERWCFPKELVNISTHQLFAKCVGGTLFARIPVDVN